MDGTRRRAEGSHYRTVNEGDFPSPPSDVLLARVFMYDTLVTLIPIYSLQLALVALMYLLT